MLLCEGPLEEGTTAQDNLVGLPLFVTTDDGDVGEGARVQQSIPMNLSVSV